MRELTARGGPGTRRPKEAVVRAQERREEPETHLGVRISEIRGGDDDRCRGKAIYPRCFGRTGGSQFRWVKGLKVRREVRVDVGKYESLV